MGSLKQGTRELEMALDALGWSKAELARRMDVHPNTVTSWTEQMPGPVREFLRLKVSLKKLSQ